jgi:hypothetical protein
VIGSKAQDRLKTKIEDISGVMAFQPKKQLRLDLHPTIQPRSLISQWNIWEEMLAQDSVTRISGLLHHVLTTLCRSPMMSLASLSFP